MVKVRKLMVILLLFLTLSGVNAQDRVQVLDSISLEPLPYVSIAAHKAGTITDEQGFFSLNVFEVLSKKDSLSISSIGYHTKRIPIFTLGNNDIIYLSPKEEQLQEITVVGKKEDPYLKFKELAPMPEGVYSFGATVVDGKIYVSGGDRCIGNILDGYYYSLENHSDKMQIYDIEKDQWSVSKLKFSSRAHHNIHYYNDKIFIIGGERLDVIQEKKYLNNIVEVYDLKKDTIISSKTNPHQANDFASLIYKDNIIMMGGSTTKELKNKIHLFNLTTGLWYDWGETPFAYVNQGIAIDSIVYLFGDWSRVYSYNISTGEYKEEKRLPFGKGSNPERAGMTVYNNIIYEKVRNVILTFNVLNKMMYGYMIRLYLECSELVYYNEKLYLIGGYVRDLNTGKITISNKLYSFDMSEFDRFLPKHVDQFDRYGPYKPPPNK
jgi:outer membrane protein assembly factor BamB